MKPWRIKMLVFILLATLVKRRLTAIKAWTGGRANGKFQRFAWP
jgi:hypothetical protein